MILKFLKFLEKIRAYPDATKRLIGYSISGGLTAIIVSMSFVIPGFPKKDVPPPIPERQMSSPFTAIAKEVSDSFSNIQKTVYFPSKSELSLLLKNLSSSQMIATSSSPKDISSATATATPETTE